MKLFFTRNLEHPQIPLFCLLISTACVAATFPVTASFWVDEALTAWVTGGTWSETLERATTYQGQPPLYFALSWAMQQLFGFSELILRIPSLVAAVVVLILSQRIVSRYVASDAACFAPLLLVASDEFQKFAISARPYMLALCMSLLALFLLIRTRDAADSRFRFVPAALSFVTAIYLHPVFVVFTPVLLLFAWNESNRSARLLRDLLPAVVLGSLALLPLAYQVLSLADRRASLFFARVPDATALLKAIFPPFPVVAFITAGICSAIFFKSFRFTWQRRYSFLLLIFVLWLISGPLLYFAHANFTGNSLFLPRIMFWRLPALAGITAVVVSCVRPVLPRHFIFLLFSVLTISGYSIRPWHLENWRETVAETTTESTSGRVALFSGLIELASLEWVQAPRHHAYLAAPYSVYAPNFTGVLLLPRNPHTSEAQQYLRSVVFPELEAGDHLVMYLTYRHNEPKYLVSDKLIALFEQSGFALEAVEDTGLVRTYKIAATPARTVRNVFP